MNIFDTNSLHRTVPLLGSRSLELLAIIILINVILTFST